MIEIAATILLMFVLPLVLYYIILKITNSTKD